MRIFVGFPIGCQIISLFPYNIETDFHIQNELSIKHSRGRFSIGSRIAQKYFVYEIHGIFSQGCLWYFL